MSLRFTRFSLLACLLLLLRCVFYWFLAGLEDRHRVLDDDETSFFWALNFIWFLSHSPRSWKGSSARLLTLLRNALSLLSLTFWLIFNLIKTIKRDEKQNKRPSERGEKILESVNSPNDELGSQSRVERCFLFLVSTIFVLFLGSFWVVDGERDYKNARGNRYARELSCDGSTFRAFLLVTPRWQKPNQMTRLERF